eukprot:746920-Hanusia_phi.AAC.1
MTTDAGTSVFVWVGKSAPQECRKMAMTAGMEYVSKVVLAIFVPPPSYLLPPTASSLLPPIISSLLPPPASHASSGAPSLLDARRAHLAGH